VGSGIEASENPLKYFQREFVEMITPAWVLLTNNSSKKLRALAGRRELIIAEVCRGIGRFAF